MRLETVFVWCIFGFCLLWDAEGAPIPPIKTYKRGFKQRVEYIKAVIHKNNLNTGTAPNSHTRAYSKSMSPYKNDDAGHLIAARLGGTGRETYNIVPQNLAQNRGAWRTQVEAPIYNSVSAGNVVTYEVWPLYSGARSTRPYKLRYIAKTSRGKVVVSGSMDNPKPARMSSYESVEDELPEMETITMIRPAEDIFDNEQTNDQIFN
ncbi:hypothetical protein GE061_013056 [Apolygus lucorum]|uniref:Type VII secretion system protein EssD-like domain-containing protein n=1 Tax=Apolygus lucorum TaxID=248454 RepID=A0A6A4JJ76_APOLU|nr:hypothetical protein GE061_013056 [Apolygus lucorum]